MKICFPTFLYGSTALLISKFDLVEFFDHGFQSNQSCAMMNPKRHVSCVLDTSSTASQYHSHTDTLPYWPYRLTRRTRTAGTFRNGGISRQELTNSIIIYSAEIEPVISQRRTYGSTDGRSAVYGQNSGSPLLSFAPSRVHLLRAQQ